MDAHMKIWVVHCASFARLNEVKTKALNGKSASARLESN